VPIQVARRLPQTRRRIFIGLKKEPSETLRKSSQRPAISTAFRFPVKPSPAASGFARSLIQQKGKFPSFMLDILLEACEVLFDTAQLIRQMKTREHRRAMSVDIAGARRNRRHQLIHAMRQSFYFARLITRQQRIRLIENRNADRLSIGTHEARINHPLSLPRRSSAV
jgi:hypothetical protein